MFRDSFQMRQKGILSGQELKQYIYIYIYIYNREREREREIDNKVIQVEFDLIQKSKCWFTN